MTRIETLQNFHAVKIFLSLETSSLFHRVKALFLRGLGQMFISGAWAANSVNPLSEFLLIDVTFIKLIHLKMSSDNLPDDVRFF